jgi:cytochrome P450
VYIIYALCDHPEYIECLRREINEATSQNPEDPIKHMPLLDSFLTKVSRLHPPDGLTVQRKVKQDFTLPSGGIIPAGNLVAIPVLAQSQDPKVFPRPQTFDGRRLLLQAHQDANTHAVSNFTDVRESYSFWGAPRKAWYGNCPRPWRVMVVLTDIY